MITKISHIGIAVRELAGAEELFKKIFENETPHADRVDDQKVEASSFTVGGTDVELTAPTSDDSPIAKFIAKRGESIHHIAFEVDDLHAELARMKSLGIQLIDEEPRLGAHRRMIAFLHPKSTNGILIELCQSID